MPHAGLGRLDPEESRWIAFDRVRCPHEWELYSSEESGNDEDDEDQYEDVPEHDEEDGSRYVGQKKHSSTKKKKRSSKPKLHKPEVPWTKQDLERVYRWVVSGEYFFFLLQTDPQTRQIK